jgi:hypothetical protein
MNTTVTTVLMYSLGFGIESLTDFPHATLTHTLFLRPQAPRVFLQMSKIYGGRNGDILDKPSSLHPRPDRQPIQLLTRSNAPTEAELCLKNRGVCKGWSANLGDTETNSHRTRWHREQGPNTDTVDVVCNDDLENRGTLLEHRQLQV